MMEDGTHERDIDAYLEPTSKAVARYRSSTSNAPPWTSTPSGPPGLAPYYSEVSCGARGQRP